MKTDCTSARVYDRIIKVSRTIADIAGTDTIQTPYLADLPAGGPYRSLDRSANRRMAGVSLVTSF